MADLHSTATSPLSQAPSQRSSGYVPVAKLRAMTRRLKKLSRGLDNLCHQAGIALPCADSSRLLVPGEGKIFLLSEEGVWEEQAILRRHGVKDLDQVLENASAILRYHVSILLLLPPPVTQEEQTVHALLETLIPVQKAVSDMNFIWRNMKQM